MKPTGDRDPGFVRDIRRLQRETADLAYKVRELESAGGGVGPAGPTGATGATGATGPAGPAGADGADGTDAFIAGDQFIDRINCGDSVSYSSTTPLVVSAFSLLPSDYNVDALTVSARLEVVAAIGKAGITVHAELYNLTDGETVGSVLDFTSTTPTKATAALTIGAAAGNLKTTEKVYELRIYNDATPADATETVELYSAYVVMMAGL